jgi:hypothetical protein
MRPLPPLLALLLAAGVAGAEPRGGAAGAGRGAGAAEPAASAAEASAPRALDALLLGPAEVPGWDVVSEPPGEPERDPDLVSWGVRAQQGRHYARHADGVAYVCSVELWAFRDVARAAEAHRHFAYPDWQIDREGNVLVMLRARTLSRGGPVDRAIFPDCHTLGTRIRSRIR